MQTIYETIADITGFDVFGFYERYNSFAVKEKQSIVSFYGGDKEVKVENALKSLESLLGDIDVIHSAISDNSYALDSITAYWDFVEDIDTIRETLLTLSHGQKWLSVGGEVELDEENSRQLTVNEGIDSVAPKLGRDPIDLAIDNNLKETGYDLAGGQLFVYNYSVGQSTQSLDSVVAQNMIGEELLGRDLPNKISFSEDSDLAVLTPVETFINSAKIILGLRQGANPERPDDGLDLSILSDRPTTVMAFPIILRKLSAALSTDDTIKGMVLKDAWFEEDALRMSVEVSSNTKVKTVIEVS